jgi:tRNA pseudouridine32 synthase / 23S rRNA pseudouridine746 synthase
LRKKSNPEMSSKSEKDPCFTLFKTSIEGISLPEKFTFPFYYEPHPLCIIAANELQNYLEAENSLNHNFGLNPNQKGLVIGKMFGVMVVKNKEGEIGYLSAFSGKLANSNHHQYFVPPIFDMLEEEGFFRMEEEILNEINRKIEKLENAEEFELLKEELKETKSKANIEIGELKNKIKEGKAKRKKIREEQIEILSEEDFEKLNNSLVQESLKEQYFLKDFTRKWKSNILLFENKLNEYVAKIEALKEERKTKSAALQNQLFDQYQFYNSLGETKNVCEIFEKTVQKLPPAGAGECAAPKLLQYAYKNNFQPIAMAEFWWGQSPNSEIRIHKNFYPACRGKCEPILGHMLQGIALDINPMLENTALGREIPIVFEDEYLLVINKPAEFLSVPGKEIKDCVLNRMKILLPNATGPLIVHRLDMSTSGLLLIAKSKDIHKDLQSQFIKRSIQKRYVALLEGTVNDDEGIIDLPLRVDLEDRPRQLVCYEHGKTAKTKWKVIERKNGKTKVYFFPITGRTHQLRMHAAHHLGLNAPIVGDDIYGKKSNRLHLHAEMLKFVHPITKEKMTVNVAAEF